MAAPEPARDAPSVLAIAPFVSSCIFSSGSIGALSRPDRLQGGPGYGAVVEWPDPIPEDLVGLMPLARDDHRVARPRGAHGRRDGLAPIHLGADPPARRAPRL